MAWQEGLTVTITDSIELLCKPFGWGGAMKVIHVGQCVIEIAEEASALMCRVVVGIEGPKIRTRYLNAHRDFDPYHKKGCVNPREDLTPLEEFGVRLRFSRDGAYWCEKVDGLCPVATYSDGLPRAWAGNSMRRHLFRKDVMCEVLLAMILEDQ